jgi:hypothetical protein
MENAAAPAAAQGRDLINTFATNMLKTFKYCAI